MLEDMTLALVLILALGILSQWLAWSWSLPAIVLMSIAGLLLGPVTGILVPSAILGSELYSALISMSVALILFEGSLSLDFREISQIRRPVFQLVTIGALIAWVLHVVFAYYIVGLSLTVSLVMGGIFIVTGPTVILPLLRQAQLKPRVAAILKWEGIIVDPFGALLAVLGLLLSEIFLSATITSEQVAWFLGGVLGAAILGAFAGWFLKESMLRFAFPEYLKMPIILAMVLLTFVGANEIYHETGLLAITVMGLYLANSGVPGLTDIKHFKENISIILISAVFIMLTASLSREVLWQIFCWKILLFVAAMLFIVRPLSVWLSTLGSGLKWREKALVGWIAPRGIVALTVSGYFAQALLEDGHKDAGQMVAITFALVFVTVIVHGFSISPLAKRLQQSYEGNPGLAIVGGSPFAAALGSFLESVNVPVLIIDSSYQRLQSARQAGVSTHLGEILMEVDSHVLDLTRYKAILVATVSSSYNTLVARSFVPAFGWGCIYQVNVLPEEQQKKVLDTQTSIMRIADYRANYVGLNDLIRKGFYFKGTRLTEKYGWQDYLNDMSADTMPILRERFGAPVQFYTAKELPSGRPGDLIVALVPPTTNHKN